MYQTRTVQWCPCLAGTKHTVHWVSLDPSTTERDQHFMQLFVLQCIYKYKVKVIKQPFWTSVQKFYMQWQGSFYSMPWKKTYFNIKFCACTSCISQLLLFKHSAYPVLHDAQTLHVCNKKHLVKSNTERNRNCFNVNSSGLLLLTCLILY